MTIRDSDCSRDEQRFSELHFNGSGIQCNCFPRKKLVVFLVPDNLGGVVFQMGILAVLKGFVSTWDRIGGVAIPGGYTTEFQIIEVDIGDGGA